MKQAEETTNHFIGCGKGILYSYEIENKTFLQKILSIGMKSCINSYIENKHERDKARTVLEKGANIGVIADMRNYSNIDLFNLNRCLLAVSTIIIILELVIFNLTSINLTLIVGFILGILPITIPLKFSDLQTRFLLNEFRKIDEISRIEDLEELQNKMKILQEKERLEKDKLACNLYLK